MIGFRVLLDLQIQMLFLAATGFILSKTGLLERSSRQGLVNISLYIIVPCNIIKSFQINFDIALLKNMGLVFLIACAVQAFGLIVSRLLYRKMEDGKRRILSYGTMISNQGFMGLPIIDALLGSTGLLYAAVALVPMRIIMWTVALAQFTKSSGKKMVFKLITHPCILAVFAGLILMLTGLRPPGALNTAILSGADCLLPLVMIALGATFTEVDIRHFISKELILFTFIRLVFMPGMVLAVLKLCQADLVVTAVTVIFAGMPGATVTAILAESYGYDGAFASKCVVFTTMLALITVPIWIMLL